MTKYLISQHYKHPVLGEVAIRVCPTSSRFSARWKGRTLSVNIPAHTTREAFQKVMDGWQDELLAKKPVARYHDGQLLEFHDFSIILRSSRFVEPGMVTSRHLDMYEFAVELGPGVEFTDLSVERLVVKHICHIAYFMAKTNLIIMAENEYNRLRITPMPTVTISHGLQRLGFCTPSGRIALSLALMFLPPELRRLIICHEAAHLTHMNHSAQFHELLNNYVDGREAALEAQLHAFAWPIPR